MGGGVYSRIISRLEELVSIESYSALGVLVGGLVLVGALREGALNLYALDRGSGELTRLNKGRVNLVAKSEYGSSRVVLARDVTRGEEKHLLYAINVEEPGREEVLTQGIEPMRIFSIVDKGGETLFTGATMEGMGLYHVKGDAVRLVARFRGIPVVNDYRGGVAAGIVLYPERGGAADVIVVDVESGDVRELKLPKGSAVNPVFMGDGSIAYVYEGPESAELRTLDPDTMKDSRLELPSKDLERFAPVEIPFLDVEPRGRLVAIARKRGRSRVFVDGWEVRVPEGSHFSAYMVEDGVLVVSHSSLTTPPRIIEVSVKEGSWRVLVEGSRPEWLRKVLQGTSYVEVESFDGSRVPTYVVESGEASKPGPTVVLVHGGPFAEYGDFWNVMAAAMASAGFHVVMPNYRGSTGYGEEWRLKIIGDPCGGELEDVVSAAGWARESGLASRVYIVGYSYGGYMTMCALTRKPGLFKAGVAGASVVDWEEMYGLSDAAFRSFIELLFGGRRELWRERSPINYVESLRDPLCIIHPQNDTRTPLKPVLRFMEKALEKGKRFEAHIAPDMGHVVNTVEDALKIILPAVLFLVRLEEGAEGTSRVGG